MLAIRSHRKISSCSLSYSLTRYLLMLRVGNHQEKTGSIRAVHAESFFFFFLTFYCVWAHCLLTMLRWFQVKRLSHTDTHTPSPPDPHPSRLPSLEQSSRCYTGGPCWSSSLNIALCTYGFHKFFWKAPRHYCAFWNLGYCF